MTSYIAVAIADPADSGPGIERTIRAVAVQESDLLCRPLYTVSRMLMLEGRK